MDDKKRTEPSEEEKTPGDSGSRAPYGAGRRGESRRMTLRLTTGALLCALNVVLLYIGSLFEVLDLSLAVVASFTSIFALIEMGVGSAFMVFGVTGALSLLLLPMPKTPALLYVVFTGFYPILKAYFERMPRIVEWGLKLGVFYIALSVLMYATSVVFGGAEHAQWVDVAVYAGGTLVFIIYDVALTRLISMYLRVWRGRLKIGDRFRR